MKTLREEGWENLLFQNHIYLAVGSRHLSTVKVRLLRHFQHPAILVQVVRTGIRPVVAQLAEEPGGIEAFNLLHHMGKQVGQFLVIILQALGIALMELPV